MPELPEVETVRRGLLKFIVGKKIQTVSSDTARSFPNAPHDVKQFLIGSTVKDVRRRAKVLMIDLSTNYTLVIHLKMTGQLVFVGNTANTGTSTSISSERLRAGTDKGPGALSASGCRCPDKTEVQLPVAQSSRSAIVSNDTLEPEFELASGPSSDPERSSVMKDSSRRDELDINNTRFGAGHPTDSLVGTLPDKSTRVTFEFADGSHLYFNDQRKFGWVRLLPTVEVPNIDFMKRVGPEPLEADFTASEFAERFKRRAKTSIKAALLDQSVIAGVGNIYADESLWGAKIHPSTLVGDLPYSKFQLLYLEVRYVMNLAIEKGGSTNKNYVNAEGKRGSYMDFARVFRREGLLCPRCDTEIVKLRVAGRGTHICPNCQQL